MSRSRLLELASRVRPLDEDAMAAARKRQNELTKPAGSLGRLETLAIQIAGIRGTPLPRLDHRAVVVFAADHGIAAEGVSAYPSAVTAQMVRNFLSGGAAINVLARAANARVVVVDIGVATDVGDAPGLVRRAVRRGSANFAREPALSPDDLDNALGAGIEILEDEAKRGLDVVLTGEMGIGNTTAASAIVAALTGRAVAEVTGRGTGVDATTYARKTALIEEALRRHRPQSGDPLGVLAAVGGLEIAGLVGLIVTAAAHRIPVLLDGFITGAAALVATRYARAITSFLIAAHCSSEPGHRIALDALGLAPLLELELRLGEGTGAALALPLIDAALRLPAEMATFASAGVSRAGA
jgi:nicotinate-nucleotide--dimethylbenzimidazole phosphoribosyltransferase